MGKSEDLCGPGDSGLVFKKREAGETSGVVFQLILVLLKVIFYFWPFLRAFWCFVLFFSRVLKQIQVICGFLHCLFRDNENNAVKNGKKTGVLRLLGLEFVGVCFVGFPWKFKSEGQ